MTRGKCRSKTCVLLWVGKDEMASGERGEPWGRGREERSDGFTGGMEGSGGSSHRTAFSVSSRRQDSHSPRVRGMHVDMGTS